jgi:Tol biopolymer transport system component
MAYVTGEGDNQRLMVQDVSGGPALEISRGRASLPRWSPDGSRLAYIGTGITVVSRLGGPARVIAYGEVFSWSPDGSRIAVASRMEQAFRVVTLHDGKVQRVALNGFPRLDDLDWDPHADRLAILTFDNRKYQWTIWTVKLDGAAVRLFDSSDAPISSPRWSPIGDTIYFFRKQSAAELLSISAAGESNAPHVLLSGLQAGGRLTVSADGRRLLHTRGVESSNLWIASLTGRESPRPITEGTKFYWAPQVSPDGRWIVMATGAGSADTIAKLPFGGGDLIPLTFGDGQADNSPVWSPDGKRILFATNRSGAPGVWIMDADGRQQRKLETSEVAPSYIVTWIPGGHVGWQQTTPGKQVNYRIRDITTGREEFLVKEGSGSVSGPIFSPRDDQVVLLWTRPERPGLWVLTWPGREDRFLTSEYARPLGWSPDGLWIYALRNSGQHVLRISARTGDIEIATTFKTGRISSGDVTPDGRYVVCSVLEYRGDAWLIENFDPQPRPKAR